MGVILGLLLGTLGDGIWVVGVIGCGVKDFSIGGMVGICIWYFGKVSVGAVLVGVVAVLKISLNFNNAIFCCTPNCVIVEAGCG